MSEAPVGWLVAAPLVLWVLLPGPPGPAAPERRSVGVDLALALLCGVGLALADGLNFARYGLAPQPLLCTDFHEYCASVGALILDHPAGVSPQRSPIAFLPSAVLGKLLGLVDGMAVAALLAMAVIGASLYLWGRALHGRVAGVLAVILSTALTPLVSLSRTLSLYPELAATFTFGAAACALALRFGTPLALLAAGIGAGACFLVEGRGLFWGLSYLGLALLAALWPRPDRPGRWLPDTVLGLGAVLAPVALSWWLGHRFLGGVACLEQVMDPASRVYQSGLEMLPVAGAEVVRSCFVWGRSSPLELPRTLGWLAQQSARVPPETWQTVEVRRNLALLVGPLQPLILGGSVLAVLGMLRGPQRLARLAALLGTAVPFVAALVGAVRLQRAHIHYLSTPAPLAALVLGLGVAVLLHGGAGLPVLDAAWRRVMARVPAPPRPTLVREALCVLLVVLLATGTLPSVLSPVASWRVPYRHDIKHMQAMLFDGDEGPEHAAGVTVNPACRLLLDRQAEQGIPPQGTLYGGVSADRRVEAQLPPPLHPELGFDPVGAVQREP